MRFNFSILRIALASALSVLWVLQGWGNLSSGRWSKLVAIAFMILAPALTFIAAVTVNPAQRGILGTPDEKRRAIDQFRKTLLLWVLVALVMLVVFKAAHWYQMR